MPIEPQRDPNSLIQNVKLQQDFIQAIKKHQSLDTETDTILVKLMGVQKSSGDSQGKIEELAIPEFQEDVDEPDKIYHPSDKYVCDFNLARWVNTKEEMISSSLIDKKEWGWPSNGKGPVKLKDMETDHIFNTIRMLVNKAVSKNLRVDGNSKMPQGAIPLHNREQEFLCAFFEIISDREDITQEHLIKLSQLAALAKTYI